MIILMWWNSGCFYVTFVVFTGCNIIPLPPKDPRAVQQLTASKPRHQRKYPLVMPNNSSSASLTSQTGSVVHNDQQLFCDQIIHCGCKCKKWKVSWCVDLIWFNTKFYYILDSVDHKNNNLERDHFQDHNNM